MAEGINVFTQSSIRMEREQVIYFDPFRINQEFQDADLIFITHNHYDHFSLEDIGRVAKKDTKIVLPEKMRKDTKRLNFSEENILQLVLQYGHGPPQAAHPNGGLSGSSYICS